MSLTAEGYMRPTYDELLTAQEERARQLFGEDIDTSEHTPLGKYIRLNVYDLAEAYEVSEKVYYSRFPNSADGSSLDRLMPFAGITRNPPTAARHIIRIIGTAGETIPIGFLVDTDDDITFYLSADTVIGEDGTAEAVFECEELGTIGNVPVGAIVNIVNPDLNVEDIEHIGVDSIARDVESDVELRERFGISVAGAGSGTLNSIRGAIMRINGVYGCIISVNETDETDADGRPPRSFECFVLADDALNQQIAEAIHSKKPVGIKTYGDVSVTVIDDFGIERIINFSKSVEQTVRVKISVKVDNYFPETGVEQIQTAIANHINNLSNGDDVIRSSLYAFVHSVEGVTETTNLVLAVDGGEFVEQNIVCDPEHVARTTVSLVEVEVVA